MKSTPTETEKRVLIAEACGFVEINETGTFGKRPRPSDGELSIYPVPDYFHSLDAMHEAEKALPANKRAQYIREVHALIKKSDEQEWHELHATATQRAEAFGRTMNLWT